MIKTTRISNYLDDNREMYFETNSGILIKADTVYPDVRQTFDNVTGETGEEYIPGGYTLRYHQGMMPSHASEFYSTIEELATAMKEITGDLRKWRVVPYEWYN